MSDPLAGFLFREEEEPAPLPVPADQPAVAEDVRDLVTFELNGELYAIPLQGVREIQKPSAITEVPRAAPHVLGVMSLRGEILPVFDPRPRLGLAVSPPDGRERVLVVDTDEGPCAVRVDRVGQVIRVAASAVERPGRGVVSNPVLVVGLVRYADQLLALLDLAALLSAPQVAP